MKHSLAFLTNLLLVTALPSSSERYAARLSRRALSRQSKPLIHLDSSTHDDHVTNKTNVQYSSNWSGSVITTPPSGTTWSSVTAEFTVPKASGSSGASASAWVGIDGDTCGTAILQTGVDFNADGTYDAWYEWYPDYAYDFSGIPIAAGNVIRTTVTATTARAGTAVITNVSTGKTVTKALTSTSSLCLENAEWIVEDFEENGGLVPLANFGTVSFTGAVATTNSGSTEGPSAGTVLDIKQSGTVLTSVSTGASSLSVTYV